MYVSSTLNQFSHISLIKKIELKTNMNENENINIYKDIRGKKQSYLT